jgi:hypothetical protein
MPLLINLLESTFCFFRYAEPTSLYLSQRHKLLQTVLQTHGNELGCLREILGDQRALILLCHIWWICIFVSPTINQNDLQLNEFTCSVVAEFYSKNS